MTREGTLIRIEGRPALRFERRYRHPVERVWRAISDPAELRRWFPSDVVGDRVVGAELVFDDDVQRAEAQQAGEPTRAEGPMFRGVVVAYDPPRVFSFTWGGELLRFELLPEGDDTVLVFTHLLSDQSVAARNGSGWHMCLAELDQLLGASEAGAPDDWMGIYEDYLHRIGPSLGVRTGDGAMTWERATHVDPDRVRSATEDREALEAWGAGDRAEEHLDWEIEPTEHGTRYRLIHHGIGGDHALAATWHALLVQLDMYLAAGQLVPIDAEHWLGQYESAVLNPGAAAGGMP